MNRIHLLWRITGVSLLVFYIFSMGLTYADESTASSEALPSSENTVKSILYELKANGMNVTPEILKRMQLAEIQGGKNGDVYSVSRILRIEIGRCVVSKDCTNPLGWEMIGVSYWNGDDVQNALDALSIAIELSSKNPLVYEIAIRAIIKCGNMGDYDIESYKTLGFECADQVYSQSEAAQYKRRVSAVLDNCR